MFSQAVCKLAAPPQDHMSPLQAAGAFSVMPETIKEKG
jgi:hypothetical protein